jgi:hypothetical protein
LSTEWRSLAKEFRQHGRLRREREVETAGKVTDTTGRLLTATNWNEWCTTQRLGYVQLLPLKFSGSDW